MNPWKGFALRLSQSLLQVTECSKCPLAARDSCIRANFVGFSYTMFSNCVLAGIGSFQLFNVCGRMHSSGYRTLKIFWGPSEKGYPMFSTVLLTWGPQDIFKLWYIYTSQLWSFYIYWSLFFKYNFIYIVPHKPSLAFSHLGKWSAANTCTEKNPNHFVPTCFAKVSSGTFMA